MATLQEMLLAPDTRPRVVADCEELVTNQVAELSGVTGAAVKLAYNTVRRFDSNHIHGMIETILPSVADALQPYWAQFSAEYTPSSGDFGSFLAARDEEVSEALLAITDRRRDNSPADHRQGVQHHSRPCGQAGEGGAAGPRAPHPEVRLRRRRTGTDRVGANGPFDISLPLILNLILWPRLGSDRLWDITPRFKDEVGVGRVSRFAAGVSGR